MATDFEAAVQGALYGALNGAIVGLAVYDHVPFEPEGAPDNNFPYAVVGDTDLAPWDTDDKLGVEANAAIHLWSRYKGRKEVRGLLDNIRVLLHRATLTAAGYKFVDCLFTASTVMVEGDGQTRHGVIRFRLTVQEN